eukprot:CAMPEP_0206024440 /NCGR_PEP_ID=MMETSP1464-20131121/38182_1 /ASSEMBLY_ACC=CAM_ASM_001124 /TAXON_ID=119497 /ORGANISM="Exanthemachrysis gayraliae, Strain RCC1523" /LENGTH=60 /DNA_ID=CAMNT_0053398449 /DNA_START=127 /DNA_END=305 /DNA_ORIENTATION=-
MPAPPEPRRGAPRAASKHRARAPPTATPPPPPPSDVVVPRGRPARAPVRVWPVDARAREG